MKKLFIAGALLLACTFSNAQIVTTFAGSATGPGYKDGTGTAAGFVQPTGIVYDGSGNLYITDGSAGNIRKIVVGTGVVTTLAGSVTSAIGHADGTGTAATFSGITGITYDGLGNLYVADQTNNEIRAINVSTGAVTTLAGATTQGHADGTGTAAGFYYPFGVACDGSGNLYVADTYNNEIRKIVISSGSVTTFAGSTTSGSLDGSGTAASFTYPAGIVYDGSGNLYVSELYGNKIRKIVISSAAVTTLAGSGGSGSADGIGALATFSQPDGLTLDGKGNLFIADGGNYEVRMLNLTTHAVTTFAGSATYGSNDGTGSSAEFYTPGDIAYTGSGVFFVVDKYNGEIRKMTAAPKPVAAFTAATTTPCAGTAVQFTDNSTNAPLAWNWTFQDGTKTITSTLQNPSITFNTPGNDSVKLVVTNYTGKDSITKKLYINVNALPTLSISENVIGGSLVCGGHDTLKANATGVATLSYAWNTSGTFDTIMVGGPPAPYNGIVTTLAGSTNPGYADGTGTSAQFVGPSGVTYDGNGNLFIADQGSNRIRKVVIATGVVTAFAGTTASGSADGTGVAASFYQPSGIAYDGNGNLFVADQNNNEIRKVVIATGAVTTFAGSTTAGYADGTGTAASFSAPTGIAYDGSGNLFVVDQSNYEIRKIVISTGVVSTFAGSNSSPATLDGTGTAANFSYPYGIVSDGNGNLYVTEQYGNDIRKIVISTAAVTTLAGSVSSGSADGTGTAASFYYPEGIAYDGYGNLYVSDHQNNEIRRIVTSTGAVSTFAGTTTSGSADGTGTAASFSNPDGLVFDASGNLYLADQSNYEIRKIGVPNFYSVTVTDGNGCKNTTSASAVVYLPATISITGGAQCIGTADTLLAHATGIGSLTYSWNPGISVSDTNIITANNTYSATVVDANGCSATASKNIVLNTTPTLTVSENILGGSLVCGLYDTLTAKATGNGSFSYKWNTSGTHDTILVGGPPAPNLGKVSTFAGSTSNGSTDGTGTMASFYYPSGVAYDGNGNLYVADQYNQLIRKIVIATGAVTSFVGAANVSGNADGTGTAANFQYPTGIAYDGNGNLFVTDQYNNEIRKVVVATGAVSTFAGSATAGTADGIGTAAGFSSPIGITYDGSGNLYVTDQHNYEIRKIVISTGAVTTFAGSSASYATIDGTGTAASFSFPYGITSDGKGNLFVTEQYGNDIRKIVISTAAVTTIAGSSSSGSADGIGTAASFNQPQGITYDGFGNLYLCDGQNYEIRKIAVSTDAVSTIAGTTTFGSADGIGSAAGFNTPAGLAFDASGNLYVADQNNNKIRKIDIPNFYAVTITDKNGCKSTTSASALVYPAAKVTVSGGAQCMGTADTLIAHATATGPVTYNWSPLATGDTNIVLTNNTYSVTITDSVGCVAMTSKNIVMNTTPTVTVSENIIGGSIVCGLHDTLKANASGNGSFVYNWNTSGTHDTIIVGGPPAPSAGAVSTFAGTTTQGYADGIGGLAGFYSPAGMTYDGNGNMYVADAQAGEIRKIVLATRAVTTFAGSALIAAGSADGTGTSASFNWPNAITYDGNGNLYVADQNNNEIRKIVIATGAVTTLAGTTTQGSADGIGTAASFYYPAGITYDGKGNLFVADFGNYEIRKIVISTGAVTTFAGSAANPGTVDGTGTAAGFIYPYGIASDGNGNLFVTEQYGNDIRKIVIATAAVTTIAGTNTSGSADGIGTAASFNYPQGIAYDGFGDLYVDDAQNNEIRKIALSNNRVTTIAGTTTSGSADGTGTAAGFNSPAGVTFDASGNLYVADYGNHEVRKIKIPNFYVVTVTDKNGCKSTVSASAVVYPAATLSLKLLQSAGAKCVALADTIIATATGTGPLSYAWSPSGSGDTNIVLLNNTYSLTVTDSNGCTASASKKIIISGPPQVIINPTSLNGNALCFGLKDSLMANVSGAGPFSYLWSNNATTDSTVVLPTVAVNGGIVTTYAGTTTGGLTDGTGTAARFAGPAGMVSDGNGNMYITDQLTGAIRKMIVSTGVVTTLAGGQLGSGFADGTGTAATFNQPQGIAYDGQGNLYVSDGANNEIRKIVIATAAVTTFAGSTTAGSADGIGTAASFHTPHGITYDGKGNLYVADQVNNEIRKIVLSTGAVTTVAGSTSSGYADGIGTVARFNNPYGIVCDSRGNLYINDTYNHEIRKLVPASGVVTTYAGSIYNGTSNDGTGTGAAFALLNSMTTDVYGNMYVTDFNEVRKIVIATASVTTVAGSTATGSADGVASGASFDYPAGLAVGGDDNLYVADNYNNEIRKIVKANTYYISVTDANGCKDSASISVGIRTLKIVGNIHGGGAAVCAGIEDTLKAVTSATGVFTYSWNNSATTDTIKVSTSGLYSVTAIDGFGCVDTASIKVVVNALPVINITTNVIGGANICAGMKDSLKANVIDASPSIGYAWYKNGSGISNYSDTITVSAAATYSVFVSDGNNCYAWATQVITVSAPPVVSISGNTIGGTTICSGLKDTLTANATGNGAFTYKWNTNGTNDTILVKSANTYSVTVTDKNGCKSSSNATVTVNPTPTLTITGNNQVSVGKADTLTASGAATYAWSTSSTSDTTIVKPTISSKYTVVGKGADGCVDTASFTVLITGIADLASTDRTTLYPNPTISYINLAFEMNGAGKDAVIMVVDASGKEVMTENASISNGKIITMDISTLAQGMYFVKVTTDKNNQVLKFIKQ